MLRQTVVVVWWILKLGSFGAFYSLVVPVLAKATLRQGFVSRGGMFVFVCFFHFIEGIFLVFVSRVLFCAGCAPT